jgi:predicted kinase
MCGVIPETLASRKGDSSDAISEVSGTAKLCTDEQELHRRHIAVDEYAHQHEVRTELKAVICRCSSDTARLFILPGEVSLLF